MTAVDGKSGNRSAHYAAHRVIGLHLPAPSVSSRSMSSSESISLVILVGIGAALQLDPLSLGRNTST